MPNTIGDLRSFLDTLAREGQLLRVAREVDARHELAAVVRAIQRSENQAVLFENVRGYKLPVVSNTLGTHERVALAMGCARGDVSHDWAARQQRAGAARAAPSPVLGRDDHSEGLLSDLPILTHCARDAGPYITGGIVVARDPETGTANLSFHRMQYFSETELGLRLAPGRHLSVYLEKAAAQGRPLEAALLLGVGPTLMLAAAARIPPEADELQLASALRGAPIPLRPCRSIDLAVPAEAEIVVEGIIPPGAMRAEGPFGEVMGYYVPQTQNNVFRLRTVTHRPEALYYGLLSGSPEEILLTGTAVAASVYQALKVHFPSVLDVVCWPFLFHVVVRIRKESDEQPRQVMLAVFGHEPHLVKFCTVVDEDVDIYDPADVQWALATRCRPDEGSLIVPGVPSFTRDPHRRMWGRLGLDATVPLGAKADFERKRIPGEADINLSDYLQ